MRDNEFINTNKLELIENNKYFDIYYSGHLPHENSFHDFFSVEVGKNKAPQALLTSLNMPLKDALSPCHTFTLEGISPGFGDYNLGFTHARNAVQDFFSNKNNKDLIVFDHGFDLHPFPGGKLSFFSNCEGKFQINSQLLETQNSYYFGGFSADWDSDGYPELFICNLSENSTLFYTNEGGKKLTPANDRIPTLISKKFFQVLSGTKFEDKNGKLHMAVGSTGMEQNAACDLLLINSENGFFKDRDIRLLPEKRTGKDWATFQMLDFNSHHLLCNYHDAKTQNGVIDLYIQFDKLNFKYFDSKKPIYEEKDCWFTKLGIFQDNIIAIKGRGLSKYIPKELGIVFLAPTKCGYIDQSECLRSLSNKEFIGFLEIKNQNDISDIVFVEHSGNYFYCRKK